MAGLGVQGMLEHRAASPGEWVIPQEERAWLSTFLAIFSEVPMHIKGT